MRTVTLGFKNCSRVDKRKHEQHEPLWNEKELNVTYEQALVHVPDALKSEGFGVLTEIDVQATLKQKIGADIRKYKILGACNPPFAHQALSVDLAAGLAMPCNVVVYEGDNGKAVVLAVDPTQTVAAIGNQELTTFAEAVKSKLVRVLEKL